MIKAVIFDQGKVRCYSENEDIRKDIAETLKVDKILVDRLWKELICEKLGKGEIDESEFWRLFYKETKATVPMPNGESLLVRAMRKNHRAVSGIKKITKELSEKGVKLAIVSNTIKPHADFERSVGHYGGIPIVILSCDPGIKARKPDHKIYQIALGKLGVKPEEAIIVDDDEIYKEGAISIGLNWITFRNARQLKRDLVKFGVLDNEASAQQAAQFLLLLASRVFRLSSTEQAPWFSRSQNK